MTPPYEPLLKCGACPFGQCFKLFCFSLIGEGDPAGEEHGFCPLVPGAVFVISHQGEAAAGELHPNLVAAACMEADADKAGLAFGQPFVFQPGLLYAASLPFYHKNLVLFAVLPQKILPVAAFRGCSMDHSHVFLYHGPLLDGFGKGSGRLLGAGIDHDAAHIQIQPVDGIDLTAKLLLQCFGDTGFRVQSHRF